MLIPRVSEDGRFLTPKEAEEEYRKTGHHLGIYSSPEEATRAAEAIHQQQAASVGATPGQNLLDILKNDPVKRAYFKYKFKFDPLAAPPQTPEEKLADKKKLEDYKQEQAIALEKAKADVKNDQERHKVVEDAKKIFRILRLTLHALEAMEKIATNNPDMFGHSGIFGFGAEGAAERYTKTSDNPNVGAWQTHGLGPIVAAEMKMTSKGNQLALKTSLANKPNLSETQPVALSKIRTNIQQIKDAIKENKKIAGVKDESDEKVTVINPQGKRFKTTKANAKHLPKGWKHG